MKARLAGIVLLVGFGFAAGTLTAGVAGPGLRPHRDPLDQQQWQELGSRLSKDEQLSTEAVRLLYATLVTDSPPDGGIVDLLSKLDARSLMQQLLLARDWDQVTTAAEYMSTHGDKESLPYLVAALERHDFPVSGSEIAMFYKMMRETLIADTGRITGLTDQIAALGRPATREMPGIGIEISKVSALARQWAMENGVQMFDPAPVSTTGYEWRNRRTFGAWDAPLLLSPDPDVRDEARFATQAARSNLINAAEEVLQQAGDDAVHLRRKAAAADLLGVLRAPEGVLPLMQNISVNMWGKELKRSSGVDPARHFPAAMALVRIGEPSVYMAREWLILSPDPLVRELCACVIREVQGAKLSRVTLEDALRQVSSQGGAERIKEALAMYDKVEW
jgi:hypothetical protein